MELTKKNAIKGYKVTNNDMKCRDYQYSIGKIFIEKEIDMCNIGFHFCVNAVDCFNYYDFTPENRVFEVLGYGEVENGSDKTVCSKIEFVKEIEWSDVLKIVNIGKNNTGHSNSGDSNSGDSNSGNWNSGNWNSGNWNSGDSNSGDSNSGHSNSGNWNSGNRNSGNWNSGHRNSGNWNSGHRNSGNWNSGDRNSGNWNSGHRNSGNWNSGNRNSGYFNTLSPKYIHIFNKKYLIEDWENAEKPMFIQNVFINKWIYFDNMTDKEKVEFKDAYITDGYLKTFGYKEAWRIAYDNASKNDIEILKKLPNFDANIFKEITGITIK